MIAVAACLYVRDSKGPDSDTKPGHLIACYENHGQDSRVKDCGNLAPTINKQAGTGGNNLPLVTAYRTSGNNGVFEQGDKTAALNTATDKCQNIVQVQWASGGGQIENDSAQALRAGAEHNYRFIRNGLSVRRLTPTECERLQGFPDGWTAGGSDSVRYRMLGNSVAVPVIRWIAQRMT